MLNTFSLTGAQWSFLGKLYIMKAVKQKAMHINLKMTIPLN